MSTGRDEVSSLNCRELIFEYEVVDNTERMTVLEEIGLCTFIWLTYHFPTSLWQLCEEGSMNATLPLVQMRKLRCRKVEGSTQSHTAHLWQR